MSSEEKKIFFPKLHKFSFVKKITHWPRFPVSGQIGANLIRDLCHTAIHSQVLIYKLASGN